MPGGPTELGFVYFAGVKFVGYTAYSAWINYRLKPKSLPDAAPEAWMGGLIRTGIGVVVGIAFGTVFWKLGASNTFLDRYGGWVFFGGLVPVRVAEWLFFLWLVYRRFAISRTQRGTLVALGIATSFLLDAIGVFTALVAPGGAWVC